MSSTPPLTTFCQTVKFMRPSFLNDLGSALMKRAFPMFTAKSGSASEHTREKLSAAREAGITRETFILDTVRRRWSGGVSLPRGSYYAVCNDEFGNDHGTLARELGAYIEGDDVEHVLVEDLVMPDHAELLASHCQAPAGLRLTLPPGEGAGNPLLIELVASGFISKLEPGYGFMLYLPLDIKVMEVEGVFDLRQREAQQWLARFLPKGNELFSMPHACGLDSFAAMLPDLMAPERGGSDLDKGLGNLLRRSGAQGLVFPSARSDVLCEFTHGQLSDFRGWNFVDYRNAAEDKFMPKMVYLDNWFTSFGKAEIHLAPDDSPYAGSWRVEGHIAQQRREMARRSADSLDTVVILEDPSP
ncbi:MAG: hypothetical protein Q7U99_22350 [Rubrivivax sp.]|nr:hypothetical protein [Rubrivivax sp.]